MSTLNFQLKETIKRQIWRAHLPKVYDFVRMCWWLLTYYVPGLVTSWFVRRRPEVHGYGSGDNLSRLVQQLANVNVAAPTKMCRVMTKYGSDKGHGYHNYTTVYSVLLKEFQDQQGQKEQSIRIFELGLGTDDPGKPSSMGVYGRPGASLCGWRELFPNAFVYGADIDRAILFQDDRIATFYCDQLDKVAIHELWSKPELQAGCEIIIEDGLHTFEANVSFLEDSIECLRPGGIYVIEDIRHSAVNRWQAQLQTVYSTRYPKYAFALVLLPSHSNSFDNNLLIIRRSAE